MTNQADKPSGGFNVKRCQRYLRAENRPYPRTCQECGLGPCKSGVETAAAERLASKSAAALGAVFMERMGRSLQTLESGARFAINMEEFIADVRVLFDAAPQAVQEDERDAELSVDNSHRTQVAELEAFTLMTIEQRNEYLVNKIFDLEQEVNALKERR